jgi:hypothetical protein
MIPLKFLLHDSSSLISVPWLFGLVQQKQMGVARFCIIQICLIVAGYDIWQKKCSMENPPTGCGCDLHTILVLFSSDPTSINVNSCFKCADLHPGGRKHTLPVKAWPS